MIVLTSTAESLYVRLSGAATTNVCQWSAAWTDSQPTRGAMVSQDSSARGLTTGNTAVAMATGIGTGQRTINSFTLWNADTVSTTFWFLIGTDPTSSTLSSQLCRFTLLTLETVTYEAGEGFRCYDANGAIKSSEPSVSTAISTATSIATAASSQASSVATFNPGSTSSQASSMATLVPASVSSQASSLAAAIIPASVNSVSVAVSSMAALGPASVASSLASVSVQQSGASAQSFTSTTWSTASSAVSRLKASFTW